MVTHARLSQLGAYVFFAFVFFAGLYGTAQNNPCSIPDSWLSGSVPEPKPEDFQSSTNCVFHQISWQYFLWLTETVEGGILRFQTLYSEDAIDPHTPDAKNKDLHLVYQAGSLGILVDQAGRATYTEMFINKVYRDFVLNNKLYDPTVLVGFDSNTDFPIGSLSLKASWKIIEQGEDTTGMYTTKANVRRLGMVDGKIGFPTDGGVDKDVPVALIGLHIAIVVNEHPEAIWATFEHVDNAPNMYAGQVPGAQVSERNYTFYHGTTTAADTNANNANTIKLDTATQILSPITQVARQYQNGGGNSSNQNNINSINQSVAANSKNTDLWRNYMEVGAVWLLQKDALVPNWSPNIKKVPSTTGSTTLSSSVIETFTQNERSQNDCFSCHNTLALIDVPSDRAILPGKNVSISHIVLQHYVKGLPVNR